MEIRESLESVRDITSDAIAAGKVLVATLIEKIDTHFANLLNGPEDEL